MIKSKICAGLGAITFCAAMSVFGAGCADLSPSTLVSPATGAQTAESARPRVENCGLVGVSSPTKYACNGKVYTTFELAKMREDEAKKYASGQVANVH
jgi:hypothetical protein